MFLQMDDFLQFFKNLEPESMFTSNNSPTVTEQSPTITNEKVESKFLIFKCRIVYIF